jgi:hypothetical protein
VWFPITTYLEVYYGAGFLGPASVAFGAAAFGFLAPTAGAGIAAAGVIGASSAAFAGAAGAAAAFESSKLYNWIAEASPIKANTAKLRIVFYILFIYILLLVLNL